MPPILLALAARMRALDGVPLAAFEPNEANALCYRAADGHYLGAHCDDRQLSGDTLVNLSLAGDAVMSYTHDRAAARRPAVRVHLPRRSLQVQTADVRFNYAHGIANADLPANGRRVSITFRCAKLTPS